MRRTIAILVTAGALLPFTAQAADEHVWLMLNGGGASYGMADLNSEFTAFNEANAGTGQSYPLIKQGMSFGGAIGYETPHQWNFGAGYDRLLASSETSNASGGMRYEFNANAMRVFGEVASRPVGSSSVRIGASVGVLAEGGKVRVSLPGEAPVDFRIGGLAPLYEGYAGGDWWATHQFAVTCAAGYRYAKVTRTKIEGGTLISSNGEAVTVDYSGPFVRLGIRLVGKSIVQ